MKGLLNSTCTQKFVKLPVVLTESRRYKYIKYMLFSFQKNNVICLACPYGKLGMALALHMANTYKQKL